MWLLKVFQCGYFSDYCVPYYHKISYNKHYIEIPLFCYFLDLCAICALSTLGSVKGCDSIMSSSMERCPVRWVLWNFSFHCHCQGHSIAAHQSIAADFLHSARFDRFHRAYRQFFKNILHLLLRNQSRIYIYLNNWNMFCDAFTVTANGLFSFNVVWCTREMFT